MRTCLTITLLLWASLASQAQAAGMVPGQAANSSTAIYSGQACHRTAWIASDQAPAFIPDYPQLAGPAFEPAPSLPVIQLAELPQQPQQPLQPRAP